MQRKAVVFLLLLALITGGVYWAALATRSDEDDPPVQGVCCGTPVPTNCGEDVPDGFPGEIHPLLNHHAEMEVKAAWDCEKARMEHIFPGMPADLDPVRRLYLGVNVAVPTRTYSERDFSGLLPPENINTAGQMWKLDPEKVTIFLKQFHPSASPHTASVGRRPGPDGAFAMLQGVSFSHLDLAFRIHAEFELAPKGKRFPASFVWYTPACFLGRVVVNRKEGTVQYFQLRVPTDEMKNIHGTVLTAQDKEHPEGYRVYQFLRAERMELLGGDLQDVDQMVWMQRIQTPEVLDRLAKLFYKFKDINFLPFDQALAAARAQKKPIFAFVALGALDDQSC